MVTSSTIFPNSQDLRNNARTYLIIHNEVRGIENGILFAADSGLLECIVFNTYMTSTVLDTWKNITSINATLNTFTLTNHGYATGDELQLNTTGTLPTPLNTIETYYVINVDSNTFKLAITYLKALNNNPIDILNVGTGIMQVRRNGPAQQYAETWRGNRKDRAKINEMNGVIAYFQSLGYAIRRQTNPDVPEVFYWVINW